MFNNIGGKIKTLAQVVCGIGIGVSVIIGLILMAQDEDTIFAGILVLILGSLSSWIGSFMTYGFGEIIERLTSIDNKMSVSSGVTNIDNNKLEMLKKWKEQGLINDTEYIEKMKQLQEGRL